MRFGGPDGAHRRIFAIALPMIASNLTVPLLGLVDTAVIGHLASPAYLAAVAVGATIFSFLFLGLNFLRMATTGVTAQALGRDDVSGVRRALGQSVLIALGLAAALLILQWPLEQIALALLGPDPAVRESASTYFLIRIWSAPAVLVNYALIGWFLGMQNARAPLLVMALTGILNMALDIAFVWGFGWKVAGVAAGTLIAAYAGAFLSIALAAGLLSRYPGGWREADLGNRKAFGHLLSINGNILVRSLALMFVFGFFTAAGARLGTVILAANALLLNFQNVLSYALDGFAHAAEALSGRAIGAGEREDFDRVLKAALVWSLALAVIFTGIWAGAGEAIIRLLTDLPEVREAAKRYLPWVVLLPLVAVWAFLLDGIYIGATRAAAMRNSMLVSAFACFLPAWYLSRSLGNDGLWLALVVFFAARALTMATGFPRLRFEAFNLKRIV
ncbi:MAG: MATE family efflux transporter [Gammaproteobacteria bacterium]|nr:MATE family efflux transporter [Gammaproteobacteria bacterium]